jgi:hypothetical protein
MRYGAAALDRRQFKVSGWTDRLQRQKAALRANLGLGPKECKKREKPIKINKLIIYEFFKY